MFSPKAQIKILTMNLNLGGGGGGFVRFEPLRQLLDDCTHKRNRKRKLGNLYITEIVFSSAFQKSTFQRQSEAEKNLVTKRQHFGFPSSVG